MFWVAHNIAIPRCTVPFFEETDGSVVGVVVTCDEVCILNTPSFSYKMLRGFGHVACDILAPPGSHHLHSAMMGVSC